MRRQVPPHFGLENFVARLVELLQVVYGIQLVQPFSHDPAPQDLRRLARRGRNAKQGCDGSDYVESGFVEIGRSGWATICSSLASRSRNRRSIVPALKRCGL